MPLLVSEMSRKANIIIIIYCVVLLLYPRPTLSFSNQLVRPSNTSRSKSELFPFIKRSAFPRNVSKPTRCPIRGGSHTCIYSQTSDIFVLSFDGVIADTIPWRSQLALQAALEIWPHLKAYLESSSSSSAAREYDQTWLMNKMSALSHVIQPEDDDGMMMGCDFVLLVRLLLEEQRLDEGRSMKCQGKYASKYHPSSTDGEVVEKNSEENSRGSRPLTVGEISVNWANGACLRETLRVKYNVNQKDPLPLIRETLCEILERASHSFVLPVVYPMIGDALVNCNNKIFILPGHQSHVQTVVASLSNMSIPFEVASCVNRSIERMEQGNTREDGRKVILLTSSVDGEQGYSELLKQIAIGSKSGSSIHVIHSSMKILKDTKFFFGDDR